MLRVLLILVLLAAGCSNPSSGPTTRPTTIGQRQDQALEDPFGYKPDFSDANISGGGITDLDRQGLKRDFDNVLNP